MRHAAAEDLVLFGKDFERQLVAKGIADAKTMGSLLLKLGNIPDIVCTSKAPRAAQTAEIIVDNLGPIPIEYDRSLYEGGAVTYLMTVNQVAIKNNVMMLVGHNPDISFFVDYLCGESVGSMKKAGIVIIEFEGLEWKEISHATGKLKLYITPKQVRNEQ